MDIKIGSVLKIERVGDLFGIFLDGELLNTIKINTCFGKKIEETDSVAIIEFYGVKIVEE